MKKYLVAAMAMMAVVAAKAEFLYFQANAFDWDGPKLFDYAMVGVAEKSGDDWDLNWGEGGSKVYLQIQDSTEAGALSSDALMTDNGDRYHATGWAQIIDDYMDSDYLFYVETYAFSEDEGQADKQLWGFSENTAKSYSELLKANHIYDEGSTKPQNVTAWVVPEPTSAMLMLLGIAGLAIRRKRFRLFV